MGIVDHEGNASKVWKEGIELQSPPTPRNGLETKGGSGDRQRAVELEGEGQAPEDHSGTVGHLVL